VARGRDRLRGRLFCEAEERTQTPSFEATAHQVQTHRIADHRRAYLHLEGPVSGDRGHVKRIDRGVYTLLEQRPECWIVRLEGLLLTGTYRRHMFTVLH